MADKITIGFHTFGTVTSAFAMSLASLIRYEGSRVSNIVHVPSPYVTEARNKIVRQFLGTKSNLLFMVDGDIQFPEDALSKTYSALKHVGADIMFGCYALGDFRPSIFAPPKPGTSDQLPTVSQNLEANNVYEIYAGSTGWLLVTREALLKIEEANTHRHWPWFDHDIEYAGEAFPLGDLGKVDNFTLRIGEDFSFSKRAREAGIKLWGTTGPLLIHDKYQPLLPQFQEEQARAAGLGVRYDQGAFAKIQEVENAERNVRQPELGSGDSDQTPLA